MPLNPDIGSSPLSILAPVVLGSEPEKLSSLSFTEALG